jgi:hypothetical protein
VGALSFEDYWIGARKGHSIDETKSTMESKFSNADHLHDIHVSHFSLPEVQEVLKYYSKCGLLKKGKRTQRQLQRCALHDQ